MSRVDAGAGVSPAALRRFAGYDTELRSFDAGATSVVLHVPSHLENYVDAEALLRDPDAEEPPYWLHLWPGSRALAREVGARDGWQGKRVVEVGCGLGLAGLVAARLGARVVFVDMTLDALRMARENARANACDVDLVQTDIRQPAIRGRFDAILLADVTYDLVLQEVLGGFLAEHLVTGGFALCADSVRVHDTGFQRACAARGLRLSDRWVREIDEGFSISVRLTEARR